MGRIKMDVDFEVNRATVADVKKALQDFQNQIDKVGKNYTISDELKKASSSAKELVNILNQSWNSKLNQLDLSKLNNSIVKTYGSVGNLKTILEQSGSGGANAFNTFSRAILNTNLQLSQSSKLLDDMADTMSKTVKWGIASSIFNNITNSVQKAYDYTVKLDTSLNDIRIVTGKSADEMNRFAVQANKVAKDLGRSTRDFTEASLIYYQQGLGNEEAQARAEVTMKAANVTGQTGQEVSEQLTAVWNGYKVTADEAELYVDKLAAVAATTASDLEELSTGMSKVASAANIMGVDVDQLNAQLATIVSVTRQAPESVGTALKTIYARMSDIESGLDDETTLGDYTEQMAQYGVNVLDANNHLRDMGDVIEEIGGRWTSMSREQQVALSQVMAGTRQYNNLLSLFDNWDMYTNALETSANAAGTLQEQQDTFMESTRAHLQQLKTEAERTYDILFNQDTVNGFADALTGVLSIFNNLLEGLGGGASDFIYFGSIVTNIFKKQIASGINNAIENIERLKQNTAALNLMREVVNQGESVEGAQDRPQYVEDDLARAEELLGVQKYISNEEFNELNTLRQQIAEHEAIIQHLEDERILAGNITKEQAAADYKVASKAYQEQVKSQQEVLRLTKEINKQGRKKADKADDIAALQQQMALIDKELIGRTDINNLKNIENSLVEKGQLSQKELNQLEEIEQRTLIALNNEMQERLAISKAVVVTENQSQAEIQETHDKLLAAYNTKLDTDKRKGQITELVQGLSTLTSLLTSVSGIVKTLNDEDLTAGEKAERIVTVLIANLPILLTNLGSLKSLLPNIATATNSAALAMGAQGVTAASGFGASLMGIISVAGPYILAIGAVVGATYALVKAYNADADAAKEAAAQAKIVKEEYKNIKTEYTELTDNISKYAESLNALKELEKGTREWKEQVLALNEQVIELLDKYPQLAQYVVNKDGALGFTTEGINQLLNDQWQAVQGAYRTNISAQLTANEKQLQSDMTDFGRTISYTQQRRVWVEDQDYLTNDGHYEMQNVQTNMTKEEMNTLVNALRENGIKILENNETLTNATGFNKELTNALMENKSSIVELNKKITTTDSAAAVFRQQDVQSYLAAYGGTNYNRLSEEDQTKITNAIAQSITKETVDRYRQGQYAAGVFGVSGWGGGRTDEEIQKEYATLMGYDTENIKNKSGKAIYKDANGEEVTISDKIAREALAQEAALKEATQGTENYAKIMNVMTEMGEKAAQSLNLVGTEFNNTAGLLKSGIQGQFDFSSATDEQLQALGSIRNDEGQWSAIQNMWGAAGWDKAGYDSAEAFTEAFDEQFNYWSAPERQAERAQNLAAIIEEQFNTALADDAKALKTTESALRSYTEHLMATNEELANDKLLAEQIAVASFQFADGVEALGKALDSNYDLLQDWRKGLTSSVEAYKVIGEMQDALEQMFNIRVSEDFIRDNFEALEDVVNGNVDALEELQEAAAEDYVAHLYINADDTRINEVRNELNSYIDEFSQKEIQVGASIDDADFINALNNMMDAGELTSDQVQQYLNSIGYEPEFDPVTAEAPSQPFNATTEVNADLPLLGPTHLATLNTSTTIDGVSATMFGISNAGASGGKKVLTGAHKIANTGARKNAVRNSGASGKKVGNGGKGKSGGGGGSKAKEPDVLEPIEKEADRYHDVNVQLELIDKDLDKLDKQKKKLFGQDLINNLNKKLGLLNKQIDVTNEKIKIARGETQELQDKLANKGVAFNADGTIANYAEAYAAQLNYVNSLIAQYNNMGAEAQEGFKDTIDKAKEDFETFTNNLDRYDEVITNLIPGLEADIQSAVDEKIDLQIEKFDMEIELRLKLAEAERDWNEFKKKIIDGIEDDDILGNAMAKLVDFSSYYKDDNTGVVQALRKQVDNTLAELNQMDTNGWSNVYGDNRTAALDDLKKYYEELMDNLQDVLKLQQEIHESYLDMMDEAQEKFDEQIESYEMISDLISHDMDVISLVYGDEAYAQLARYYDKQQDNYNSQLDFQRQQVDFWRQQLDTLDEGSDAWKNARDKWANAVQEMNDLIETSIENLQDKYLNAINLIFQNLNNKVTDNLGLDYVEEEWNLINQNADQYLDTINSLYGIQNLENKYLDALDNTDSIAAQRQLKEIMDEELTNLRERDKLTEYDVERANKRYEIALKQIALQEAQQNKTKMRLRRDSQGNYRYEYTSDADQVGQLQDELNDMYNSLYNFDKARYQDNLNQMYEVWAEFQEKMAEAAQINDPVARSERELLLQTQYEQLINGLTEQNATVRENLHESAFDDLSRLYDVDVANFQNMSDEEKNVLMGDLLPYWESGVQHMTDIFAGEDGFLGVCQDAFDQLHDATKDYEDGLDELENTGRMDFESIGEGIDENINRTQQLITDNTELINTYEQELSAIGNVIAQLDGLIDKYNSARDAAVAATKAAYEYWSQQQREAAAAAGNANGGSGANSNSGSNNSSDSANGSGNGSGSGDGNLVVGETATYSGKYYYDSYGTAPAGSRYSGVADGIVVDKITNNPYGIHIHSADGKYRDLGWIKKAQLSGYDTGGYTGEWGSDGRLALLHQKELVLNKEDTANMLNAISIMRNITNMLGSSVLGKLAAATAGNLNTDVGNDVLEQNVHIDAQFPNARDSREIEEALNNLVNMATMRANRK